MCLSDYHVPLFSYSLRGLNLTRRTKKESTNATFIVRSPSHRFYDSLAKEAKSSIQRWEKRWEEELIRSRLRNTCEAQKAIAILELELSDRTNPTSLALKHLSKE
jgi:hypothetical protein